MAIQTRPSRRLVLSATIGSALFYGLVIWCEAARHSAGIGFAEIIDWPRVFAAFDDVSAKDFGSIRFGSWDYLAWAGMFCALFFTAATSPLIPKWVLAGYLVALLAAGGWMGLVLLPYLPYNLIRPHLICGEFFIDHIARIMACGVWVAFVLWFAISAFRPFRTPWKGAHP